MEYALRLIDIVKNSDKPEDVLILVLMEYALRRFKLISIVNYCNSLNPCSNGICSSTKVIVIENENEEEVLILVLMEYALRPNSGKRIEQTTKS